MKAEGEKLFLPYPLVDRVWASDFDFAETTGMYNQLLVGKGWSSVVEAAYWSHVPTLRPIGASSIPTHFQACPSQSL